MLKEDRALRRTAEREQKVAAAAAVAYITHVY
jgi:hypothetical protein